MVRSKSAPAALGVCWVLLWLFVSPATADEEGGNTEPAAAATKDGQSAEEQIRRALDEKTSLKLEEIPLRDFAELLRDRTGLNVLIDNKSLNDVGFADDAPLTGELHEISLRSILNIFLGRHDLTWIIADGALVITTPEEAESRLLTRVHNVKDLVAAADCDGPECYDTDSLIHVISSTVYPEMWDSVGGPASIEAFRDTLAISQTEAVHQQIAWLLEAVRRAQKMDAEAPDAPTSIRLTRAEDEIFAALAKPITLEAADIPLAELPALLGEKLDIQFVIDHKALDDVGIGGDVPLRITVKKMRASDALSHLLRPLDLTWMVANEVLVITTPEEAQSDLAPRVYPVRDFVTPLESSADGFDGLMNTVTYSVEPDTWEDVGGPGAIEPLPTAGVLVISQTAEIHTKVEDLLIQLRKRLAEERKSPAAAVKVDPNALHLIVYDIPQPLPTQSSPPQQQSGQEGDAQQPNAAPGGGGLFQFGNFGGGTFGGSTPIPGDDLVEIVTSLVEPESWNREGVYIKAVPGRLIVRQTAGVHRKIKPLLVQLGLRSPWDWEQSGFGGVGVVGERGTSRR
jgi:hypothetical protein